jgi:peptidoglycan/xylan/chitin deacetylase (PgdA/CDA1 family)
MICLTGDIHHGSLGTNDQRWLAPGDSEVKIAARFTRLVQQAGLKITYYVTGKTLVEEWDDLCGLASGAEVELGGHTFAGLPAGGWMRFWYTLRGLTPPSHAASQGPPWKQRRDIRRTIEAIAARTGRQIVAWRSHGLVRDRHTNALLAECGIRMISDEVSATKLLPERTPEGLVSHPMNVLMDHDHLLHAHRDATFVAAAKARGYGADAFGCESYSIEEWGEIVREQVAKIQERGGLATVLMHPICQYLADEFRTAAKLLAEFARYETVWAAEIPGKFNTPGKPGR